MAAKRIAGVAHIVVDGNPLSLRGDLNLDPDNIEREGIAGQDGVHGFKEIPKVPYIEGNFTKDPNLSLEVIRAMDDVTVQAECADGTQYIFRNAWTAGARELDTGEGQVQIRWEATEADEVMPGA
jgi:hypothetical protein